MTFADAVGSLTDGRAAKRSSWGGYVYKEVTSESTATTETYTLTFKNRSGTEYVYTYDGTSWTAPSTTIPFDAEIIASMVASDWTTGSRTDFEIARSGSGVW